MANPGWQDAASTTGATQEADGLRASTGEQHLREELERAQGRILSLETALERNKALLQKAQDGLFTIYTSNGWKLIARCCQLRDLLLPRGSRRYRVAAVLGESLARLGKRLTKISFQPRIRSINRGYARWIERNEPGPEELDGQRHTLLTSSPCISLLSVIRQPETDHLAAMLRSVQDQTYSGWELCLAVVAAPTALREELARATANEPRVRLRWLERDLGEAGNWSAALALAAGGFVARLGQADTLAPFALYEIARAITNQSEVDVVYSDEDRLRPSDSVREWPRFKPDWSPDTFRSQNYVGDLAIVRRSSLVSTGGFRPGYEHATWYEALLRCTEKARKVVHVPAVLYHQRADESLVSSGGGDAGIKAVHDQLNRLGIPGSVQAATQPGVHDVRYEHRQRPLISIIIPNKDYAAGLARCIQSIRQSTYESYEILVVENNSVQPETFACYDELRRAPATRVIQWNNPFNYSALNNFAAAQAGGDVLLFLNNDMEVITPDWLERMLEHALRSEVGAVGAKLFYADQTVQHAGVVIGLREILGHVHRHFPRESTGYDCRLASVQNFSAVTAACLMMRKEDFKEIRGFDEEFALDFNDIDLCLRLGRQGYRIVWTPYAELYHFESKTRGYAVSEAQQVRFMRETHLFQTQWAHVFRDGDPYYNPNLTRDREDFSLRI